MKAPGLAFVLLIVALLAPATAFAAAPIKLWHAYRDDEEKALADILARVPDVEKLSLPHDAYRSKLAASIPHGEGPDLFIDSHDRIGDYRSRRIIAPVGDAFDASSFDAQAVTAVRDGQEAWAVPLSHKSLALFMNTRLVHDVPGDLEEIVEMRSRLPKGVFPLVYEARKLFHSMPFLTAFGGRVLDAGDQFGFIGQEAERLLSFVRMLHDERAVPEEADGALVTNLFKSGGAAFAISGPWLAASLISAKVEHFRVVPLPKIRETGHFMRPFLTVEAVMMTPAGAQRPEVRELARLLAGPLAARIRAEKARTVTTRVDVPVPESDPVLSAFAEQAKRAVLIPSQPAMNSAWDPSDKAIQKVLRGDVGAHTALVEAKRRYDDARKPLPGQSSRLPFVIALGVAGLALAVRWLRLARSQEVRSELRRSLPAYRYVAHAVLVVSVLVILPLAIGALTSFFAGTHEERRFVGLANFVAIITARGGPLLASGSFYLVLLVTLLWTVVNVALHVAIGVSLGLLLSQPFLRLRAVYRVLLVIPWAVPSYVTALAWKGMFHRQFGAVTGLVHALNRTFGTDIEPVAWFARFSTAFTANVATNVWLGFPFMMVVTLGALTAVPGDVLEAARVDGATRWQRLRLVTLPMIRPTLAPAVTLGAIWTFNMFNVVYLVSGGDPDGSTDILVSEAYRWAFTGEARMGYAAAYAVLIFLLLLAMTRISNRRKEPEGSLVEAATLGAPSEVS